MSGTIFGEVVIYDEGQRESEVGARIGMMMKMTEVDVRV